MGEGLQSQRLSRMRPYSPDPARGLILIYRELIEPALLGKGLGAMAPVIIQRSPSSVTL
jgi:hypothetical protein